MRDDDLLRDVFEGDDPASPLDRLHGAWSTLRYEARRLGRDIEAMTLWEPRGLLTLFCMGFALGMLFGLG